MRSDSLTGIADRDAAITALADALEVRPTAIVVLDLDRFKRVNNSFGHKVGDEVLRQIAGRISGAAGHSQVVARLDGDSFAVVCRAAEAETIAARLLDVVDRPVSLPGRDAVITASIGVAHGATGASADDVLRNAEVALDRAKEHGRDRIELYDESLHDTLLARVQVEQALRRSLVQHELQLHFQPIVSLDDGRIGAVEALMRWEHPLLGDIRPSTFVPIAEDAGMATKLGRWVIAAACAQAALWQEAHPGIRVDVNLTSTQFSQPDLPRLVERSLASSGLPPGSLGLEVTEGVLMRDVAGAVDVLLELVDLGVHVTIDDFGTGYSSLAYLRELPVSALKIDKVFVDRIGDSGKGSDEAIIGAIVAMAGALGMAVVAEGVEHPRQLEVLRELGCGWVQGFLTGRPKPADGVFPDPSAE